MSKSEYVVATTGTVFANGEFVGKGSIYEANHPVVKANPEQFRPVEEVARKATEVEEQVVSADDKRASYTKSQAEDPSRVKPRPKRAPGESDEGAGTQRDLDDHEGQDDRNEDRRAVESGPRGVESASADPGRGRTASTPKD